jgi:hypothetical protein
MYESIWLQIGAFVTNTVSFEWPPNTLLPESFTNTFIRKYMQT